MISHLPSVTTPIALDEANGSNDSTPSFLDSTVNKVALAVIAVVGALIFAGVGLLLAGMVTPMIITMGIAVSIAVTGGVIYAMLPAEGKKSVELPGNEAFQTLIKGVPDQGKATILEKWEDPQIAANTHTLVEQFKACNFNHQIFNHPDVEFFALYAGSSEVLTPDEIAPILMLHSMRETFGKDKVEVHVLTNEDGSMNETAKKLFSEAARPVKKQDPDDAVFDELRKLPRHLQLFFTAPDDENNPRFEQLLNDGSFQEVMSDKEYANRSVRQQILYQMKFKALSQVENGAKRFDPTPALMNQYLKAVVRWETPEIVLTLGEAPFDDFLDFDKRCVFIPFSLAKAPEMADSIYTKKEINFTYHDLVYHTMVDAANCHRKAFARLLPVIKDFAPAHEGFEFTEASGVKRFVPSLYENYTDRMYPEYFQTDFGQQKDGAFFWKNLVVHQLIIFSDYLLHKQNSDPQVIFDQQRAGTLSLEKDVRAIAENIVDAVGKEHEHWIAEYGISLADLIDAGEQNNILPFPPLIFDAMIERAKRYLSGD